MLKQPQKHQASDWPNYVLTLLNRLIQSVFQNIINTRHIFFNSINMLQPGMNCSRVKKQEQTTERTQETQKKESQESVFDVNYREKSIGMDNAAKEVQLFKAKSSKVNTRKHQPSSSTTITAITGLLNSLHEVHRRLTPPCPRPHPLLCHGQSHPYHLRACKCCRRTSGGPSD